MALMKLTPLDKGFAFGLDTDKALRAPIGAASPLWLAFAGAASAGVALWLMARWMRSTNLEPVLMKAKEPVAEPAEVDAKAAEPVVVAAPEPVAEPVPPALVAAPVETPVAATPVAPPEPAAKPKVAAPKTFATPAATSTPKIMNPSAAAEALVARRKNAAKAAPEKPN